MMLPMQSTLQARALFCLNKAATLATPPLQVPLETDSRLFGRCTHAGKVAHALLLLGNGRVCRGTRTEGKLPDASDLPLACRALDFL